MPITFAEMVQDVINEVRAKEAAVAEVRRLEARVRELEAENAELKKQQVKPIVREPDKPMLAGVKEK